MPWISVFTAVPSEIEVILINSDVVELLFMLSAEDFESEVEIWWEGNAQLRDV
jgi:hypothetical protein